MSLCYTFPELSPLNDMGYTRDAIVKHFNGTATTAPAVVDFNNMSGSLLIHNLGTVENLLVSFDGGTTFKTIPPETSLGIQKGSHEEVSVKTTSTTTDYEILVTVDE